MHPLNFRPTPFDGTSQTVPEFDLTTWRDIGLVLCLIMLAIGLAGFWIKFAL